MRRLTRPAILVLAFSLLSCNNTERDHPYENDGNPTTGQTELLPGLPNLGGTCFANASINLLLSSKDVVDILSSPLSRDPTEPQAHYDLRAKFQKTLKNLYDARKSLKKDLTDEVNAYFDAYEEARKEVIAGGAPNGEKVGGKDKLRKEQGDARDFIEDNLRLLQYAKNNTVTFTYHIFTNDNSTKVLPLQDDVLIGFKMAGLPNNEYSVQQLYQEWSKPEFRGGADQIENNANVKQDSNRYDVFREPPNDSLFIVAYRFITGDAMTPPKRLQTRITPSEQLTIKMKNPSHLAIEKQHVYDLKTVVVQRGVLGGGHYYAYVYNKTKKRWEKYNDREVTAVKLADIVNDAENGYIYLYELRAK